jgi:hypothetical protein
MKSKARVISFDILLLSLVLLLIIPSLVSTDWVSVVSRVLYSLTMLASLYLVSANPRDFVIGILLFIPSLVTKWMLVPLAPGSQLLLYCVFHTAFLVYVLYAIYRYLLGGAQVNRETILASILLYLLFGFALSLVYLAILLIDPASFAGKISIDAGSADSVAAALRELIYFSFVTQTTLGYGDISPTGDLSRTTAVLQAITGQLYLAIVIARLVGLYISSARR